MKKYLQKLVLTCCVLLPAISAIAQVTVSLTLRPPYSAYIKDYYHLENKAIILLTNTSRTPVDVKLGGSISNESRGIYVRTEPAYRPPVPIRIAPNATVTLTANPDAMNFFDQGNVSTNANDAMLANIIRSGMLPEGTYRICVNAYDFNSGRQLSNSDAGCFSFNISQADPPLITFPQNNYVYPAEQKNLNFSWTPPMGNLSGAIIEYDQIVVKVQPGQNPNDAIAAARDFGAGNPVLNKRRGLSQTYITQSADLPFEPGNYVMQVVARDRNQKILLVNEGRSEIVQFQVGATNNNANNPGYQNANDIPDYYAATTVTGNLKYYWPVPATGNGPIAENGFTSNQNSSLKNVRVELVLGWQVQNTGGLGFYLPGGVIPPHWRQGVIVEGTEDDDIRVLASATTGGDGSFSFNVPDTSAIDFGWINGGIKILGAGGIQELNNGVDHVQVPLANEGPVRRVLMVMVNDMYYCQPIQYKNGFPQNKDLGTFYSRVKTINATLRVEDKHNHSPKTGMEVLLMRKAGHRPASVPKDEMSPGNFSTNEMKTIGGQNYEVIAKNTTDMTNGEVTFNNMVFANSTGYAVNENPYDKYYWYTDDENTNYSLQALTPKAFVYDYKGPYDPMNPENVATTKMQSNANYSIAAGLALNANAYMVPQTYYNLISTEDNNPRILTTVRNTSAGTSNNTTNRAEENVNYYLYKIKSQGMQQAKVIDNGHWGSKIASMGQDGLDILSARVGNNMTLERSGITGSDGKIDLKELGSQWSGNSNAQIGYYRFLMVKKSGFNSKLIPAKIAPLNEMSGDMAFIPYGETYQMNDVEIKPSGSLFVKLVNERGQAIAGKAYYTDPLTGQNGTAANGQWREENDGTASYIIGPMAVPTGQQRIVVHPTETGLYSRDTVTIDVPEGTQHQATVVVKYKLHRIYFNVSSSLEGPLKNAKVELLYNAAVMYNDLKSPFINNGVHSEVVRAPMNDIRQGVDDNPGQDMPARQPEATAAEILNEFTKKTNSGGGVDFAFRTSTDTLNFRITGPQGEVSYVTVDRQVVNEAGKVWQKEMVVLNTGRKIKGTVKLGSVPIANARVQIIGSSPLIETMTDADGNYEMNGAPAHNLRFSASKQGYQGMEYDEANPGLQSVYGIAEYRMRTIRLNLSSQQSNATQVETTINFKLRIYENLDLSKLLGFPLEVTALKEIRNAAVKGSAGKNGKGAVPDDNVVVEISGLVKVSDSLNTIFKLAETSTDGSTINTIRLERLLVVADDIKNDSLKAYSRPQQLPVRTSINEQHITVYGFYNSRMKDEDGIALNKLGSGPQSQGITQSKVSIDLSSFTDNNIGLADGEHFFLAHAVNNTLSSMFPVFTSSGITVVNGTDGIPLSNAGGSDLNYKLHDFDAIAAAGSSRIYKDSMVLDTRLQTNLQYVPQPNLDIAIGKVKINSSRELEDLEMDISKTSSLGSFRLKWNHIRISGSDGGVKLNGVLEAADMSLPFSNALLYPTQFQITDGSLAANNVRMLDVIEVQVNTGASFGYEAGEAAWVLAIYGPDKTFANPSAAFSTEKLQGFPVNGKIPISSIYLYSNDTRDINLYNSGNYTYRMYDIADFTINNILPAQSILKMPGTLGLGIPGFLPYSTAVQYEKLNDDISGLMFQYFNMDPVSVNGIVMGFNPGNNLQAGNSSSLSIAPGKIVIKGTVSDERPDIFKNIHTTLTKTNQATELVIDEPAGERQTMKLGGSDASSRMILSEIAGKMWVTNNAWNHLYIEGDMPEQMGFTADGKRMRFEVFGDLKVNSQQVKLKNINTPFGNIHMEYDLVNHRLSGGLQVGGNAGGAGFSGAAAMVIDKSGYYFMSGLSVTLSSPKIQGNAFMLIGDYGERTAEMDAMLSQYSVFIRKKVEISMPLIGQSVLDMLSDNPQAALSMISSSLGDDYLPLAYTKLFNGGSFNGFYFNAGASIPLPVLPNFKLDLSPVGGLEMGVNGGIDVRFGANFASENAYGVGFSVFLDAAFGGGGSAVVLCVSGRIGILISASLDGVFTDNSYTIHGEAELLLAGYLRVGVGICAYPCDAITCLNVEASGSLMFGLSGTITENSEDFKIYLVSGDGVNKTTNTPPPAPEE